MLHSTRTTPFVGQALRKLVAPLIKPMQNYVAKAPPFQPFGPDFGLTILPEYLNFEEKKDLRVGITESFLRLSGTGGGLQQSDGRYHLPPVAPYTLSNLVDRLEADGLVLPGWLNNQTVNMFTAGDYIRAHVDNLFLYDDTFAIASLGSPATIKFVHLQNGEELSAYIPEGCVYILEGPARYIYFHMIPPVETSRMSVVLRKCFLKSSGTFRDQGISPMMKGILPYKSNAIVAALLSKDIGIPRVPIDDAWLEANGVGPFDTGKFVQSLRPLKDWSLMKQLEEDEQRHKELLEMKYLTVDLSWRFDELRKQYGIIEKEVQLGGGNATLAGPGNMGGLAGGSNSGEPKRLPDGSIFSSPWSDRPAEPPSGIGGLKAGEMKGSHPGCTGASCSACAALRVPRNV